jgi:hypothetical protein
MRVRGSPQALATTRQCRVRRRVDSRNKVAYTLEFL